MMAIRRFRKKYCILFSILASTFLSGFFILNLLTNDNLHILHLYLYKANEFFLPYYHQAVLEIPDDVDYNNLNGTLQVNTQNKNFLCIIPEIRYDNKLAIEYLNKDFLALNKTFYQCDDAEKEFDLVFLNDYTLFDVETKKLNNNLFHALKQQGLIDNKPNKYKYVEFYSMKLDFNRYSEIFDQDVDDINCYAQRFDKKLNISEIDQQIVMIDEKRKFEKKFNFTLYYDNYGYFYVTCFKGILIKSKIYENVYNVFPRNMSILRENRKRFIQYENKKRRLIQEKPEKINFDENEENFKIVKKMNVIILGYDSLSSNHFKRVFPLTYEFLNIKLENTVIYDALSSVGHNTFPNIIALMSGIIENYVTSANLTEGDMLQNIDGTFFDFLPFLWYEFEKLGYVTSFMVNTISKILIIILKFFKIFRKISHPGLFLII